VIGLSILSGSHAELIPAVLRALREAGAGDVPVVVGGIIPDADAAALREAGVAAVYTPKDWDLNKMMRDMIALVGKQLDDSGAAHFSEAGRRAGGTPEGVDTPAPA
jgi:(2R)-ethylmalonyl-CoA mutase